MYFTGSTADAWDNLFITILSFHAILHYSWKYLINGTAHLPLKIFFYFQYLFPSVYGSRMNAVPNGHIHKLFHELVIFLADIEFANRGADILDHKCVGNTDLGSLFQTRSRIYAFSESRSAQRVQYFRRPAPHIWNDSPIHRGWTDKLLLMPVLLFYDLVPYKVPPETKMPPVGDITHYIRKSVTLYLQTSSRTLRGKEDEKCSIAASPVFHPPEYHYSAFYIFAIHFFCHFVLKSCHFSGRHILLHILQCQ